MELKIDLLANFPAKTIRLSKEQIPLFVSGLVTILLLISIGQAICMFLSYKRIAQASVYAPVAIEQTTTDIASWHLFGVSSSCAALIPTTDLKLTLRGLLVASPAKNSQAIISELGKEEKVYSIGDALPGGAILYKILVDSVILKHNGRLEKLTPPELEDDLKPLSADGIPLTSDLPK